MADPRDLLPPGFQIETPTDPMTSLPAGFKIEQPQAAPSIGQPSTMDYLRANPVIGAPTQTLLRAGQGIEQLLAHGAGLIPGLGGIPKSVDEAITSQNRGYEEAKQRVVNASTNPRLQLALTNTGEFGGNLLNPSGAVGNLVPAIRAVGPLANAAVRGAASGAGFGASQPVLDNPDFWTTKTSQVLTGTAMGAGTGALAERLGGKAAPMAPAPPTAKDLKAAASDAYQRAEQQGVVIRQDSFKNAVNDIEATATKSGMRPRLDLRAADALDAMKEEANAGNLTLAKADELRQVASRVLNSQDAGERRIGHIIIDKLDDYIGGLKPADIAAGNAPEAISALNEARGLYAKGAKAATIDRLVERARNATGANYTAAGMDTALRQQFRALANNDRAMRRFSPDEQAAILQVVRGTPMQNALRLVGKLSPNSAFPIAGELAAAASGHGGIAAGAALAGAVSKEAAAHLGKRNVNDLSELVRRGSVRPPPLVPGPAPNLPVGNAASPFVLQFLLNPGAQQ